MTPLRPMIVALGMLALMLVPQPALAGGTPSADPLDPARMVGGEILVYTLDERDLDQGAPGSVTDASGRGTHGMLLDGPVRIPGKHADAVQFDGSSDRIRIDQLAPLQAMRSGFTFSTWLSHASTPLPYGPALFSAETANGDLVVRLSLQGGRFHITHLGPVGGHYNYDTQVVLAPDVWQHLAVTFTGGSLALVLDGNVVWTAPSPGIAAGASVARASVASHGDGGNGWRGSLDDVRIYDRALTVATIRSLGEMPYFHPNAPPTADAGADLAVGCAGAMTDATLDGSASSDENGDALTFAWSADGIVFDDATSESPRGSFPLGMTNVTVSVSDGEFETSDVTRVNVIDATPPVVESFWPAGPGVYQGDAGMAGGVERIVLGSVNITAVASDVCTGIAAIVFEADDGTRHVDDEAPYAFDYAPEGLGIQYRVVRIVAIDGQGNVAAPIEIPLTVVAVAPRT